MKEAKMTEELKACPFCGGRVNMTIHTDEYAQHKMTHVHIECKKCDLLMVNKSPHLITAQWNTRPESQAWSREQITKIIDKAFDVKKTIKAMKKCGLPKTAEEYQKGRDEAIEALTKFSPASKETPFRCNCDNSPARTLRKLNDDFCSCPRCGGLVIINHTFLPASKTEGECPECKDMRTIKNGGVPFLNVMCKTCGGTGKADPKPAEGGWEKGMKLLLRHYIDDDVDVSKILGYVHKLLDKRGERND